MPGQPALRPYLVRFLLPGHGTVHSYWLRFYTQQQIDNGYAMLDAKHILSIEHPGAGDIHAAPQDEAEETYRLWSSGKVPGRRF